MKKFLLLIGVMWLASGMVNADERRVAAFGPLRFLRDDGGDKRRPYLAWSEHGKGARITWTLLTEEFEDKTLRNCRRMTSVQKLFGNSHISIDEFKRETEQAFERWSAIADLEFRYTTDIAKANIVIGTQVDPNGWAYADYRTLEYEAALPRFSKGVICLNPAREWRLVNGDDQSFTVIRTIDHEIGHLLGLDHPSDTAIRGVMSHRFIDDFVVANEEEKAAVRLLYGPPKKKTSYQ